MNHIKEEMELLQNGAAKLTGAVILLEKMTGNGEMAYGYINGLISDAEKQGVNPAYAKAIIEFILAGATKALSEN
jgi:hypothetical protein